MINTKNIEAAKIILALQIWYSNQMRLQIVEDEIWPVLVNFSVRNKFVNTIGPAA